MADTRPMEETEAVDGSEELHTPPLTVLLNAENEPGHKDEVPDIVPADGAALTTIPVVAIDEPHVPVDV